MREVIRFSEALQAVYRGIELHLQPRLAREDISCKRGCYHCCRIVACISLAEGWVLAYQLLQMPRVKRLKVTRQLREAAVPVGMSNDAYAQLGRHCGFLDLETKDCLVYEHRPASCRFHFVVSPAADCIPGEPKKICILDTVELESFIHVVSKALTGTVMLAPLPNMVLHCLIGLDPTKKKTVEGVPNPLEWTRHYMAENQGELAEMRAALNTSGPIEQFLSKQVEKRGEHG